MQTLTSTIEAVSKNELEAHEWNNKSVIFRRERLSPALIEEFGTMAVDTIYKVEGVKPGSNNQQLEICCPSLFQWMILRWSPAMSCTMKA